MNSSPEYLKSFSDLPLIECTFQIDEFSIVTLVTKNIKSVLTKLLFHETFFSFKKGLLISQWFFESASRMTEISTLCGRAIIMTGFPITEIHIWQLKSNEVTSLETKKKNNWKWECGLKWSGACKSGKKKPKFAVKENRIFLP